MYAWIAVLAALLVGCLTQDSVRSEGAFAYSAIEVDRAQYEALERFNERYPHITVEPLQWPPGSR